MKESHEIAYCHAVADRFSQSLFTATKSVVAGLFAQYVSQLIKTGPCNAVLSDIRQNSPSTRYKTKTFQ